MDLDSKEPAPHFAAFSKADRRLTNFQSKRIPNRLVAKKKTCTIELGSDGESCVIATSGEAATRRSHGRKPHHYPHLQVMNFNFAASSRTRTRTRNRNRNRNRTPLEEQYSNS